VLLVSSWWGLWLGLLTAFLSVSAFNSFRIPPTGRFAIADGENRVAPAVFLVSAAVVSTLADVARTRAEEAERRSRKAPASARCANMGAAPARSGRMSRRSPPTWSEGRARAGERPPAACEPTTPLSLESRAVGARLGTLLLVALLVSVPSSCSKHSSSPHRDVPVTSARPPVVMLVFDEFSTVSLLDSHGRIDPVRYPHFAALARGSTWFPNTTASLDETGRALRSLFTGRTLWRWAKPTYAEQPDNLFTMLAHRYRMNVSEEASSLCPPRLCPGSRAKTGREVVQLLESGRPERFENWLRSIRPASKPTFYFKHLMLPHAPWVYLPSGHKYGEGATEARLSWDTWHYNRWLVDHDYQRHLLQVGFTDRLLGNALDRLRATGLYDRSLIVVTADNGESFGRLGNGHNFNSRNAGDIALTPLIVKLPFQTRGRVDRRHVRTIDVLPTIAMVAHVRPDWRVEGRPVFGSRARGIPRSTLVVERSGRRTVLSPGELRRRMATALRLKLRLFGSGDAGPGLYGIGAFPSLHGTPVSRWPVLRPGRMRAIVDAPGTPRQVSLNATSLPVNVSGRLAGSGSRQPMDLAIAVNGTIVATAPAVAPRPHAPRVFALLVPDSALREGDNDLEIFGIEGRAGAIRLRPLTP
jgi:hypothetical protein